MFRRSRSVLSSILYANQTSSVELPTYEFLTTLVVIIVMDDKGGIGKSLLAQVLIALCRSQCDTEDEVMVIDSDSNNSSSYQIDPNAAMLDLKRNREAPFLNAFNKVREGKCRHIVVDVGAREEHQMIAMLPWLLAIVAKLDGRVIVARPITLGSHNQRNARRFMDVADKLDIPTIFVENEGQGRESEYFYDWRNSQTYAEASALGAVHTQLLDFGVRHSDEAIGLGLSIADCAIRDFNRITDEEDRKYALEYFLDDICMMLNERLRMCMRAVGDASQEAVALRAAIVQARLAANVPATLASPQEQLGKQRKKNSVMKAKLREAHAKMRRAGADPRRADPRYSRPVVLDARRAITIVLGIFALGLVVGAAGLVTGSRLAGLYVASPADARLVAIVRAAAPDADTVGQDDLVARLAVPQQMRQLLIPLIANDPARATVVPGHWPNGLFGSPVTSPSVMKTLSDIAAGLAPLPETERSDQISTVVSLYNVTRDVSSRTIIAAVTALPSERQGQSGRHRSPAIGARDDHRGVIPDRAARPFRRAHTT